VKKYFQPKKYFSIILDVGVDSRTWNNNGLFSVSQPQLRFGAPCFKQCNHAANVGNMPTSQNEILIN
jgi:hypothetical protein